jgi:hypothetical protein
VGGGDVVSADRRLRNYRLAAVAPNDNLAELHMAEAVYTCEECAKLMHVLIGVLSHHVDAQTWASSLNTTYGYINTTYYTKKRGRKE